MNTFRDNLKLHLSFSRLTVKELAALSGVNKATLDSYLNNRVRMPSAEAALRIAQVLGVTVEHLFGAVEGSPGTGREAARQHRETKVAAEAQTLAEQIRRFTGLLEGVTVA